MLSKDLSNIIANIQQKVRERESRLKVAAENDSQIKTYSKWRDDALAEANKLEQEIDQLQLEMRKVLNGEQSTVPVAPPASPDEVIGREG